MIRNAVDWWNAVDGHWFELLKIMHRYLPMGGFSGVNGEILTECLAVRIDRLRSAGDVELVRYFNAAWSAAPDTEIHGISGWGILCDLCSESEVLYGDEERENL